MCALKSVWLCHVWVEKELGRNMEVDGNRGPFEGAPRSGIRRSTDRVGQFDRVSCGSRGAQAGLVLTCLHYLQSQSSLIHAAYAFAEAEENERAKEQFRFFNVHPPTAHNMPNVRSKNSNPRSSPDRIILRQTTNVKVDAKAPHTFIDDAEQHPLTTQKAPKHMTLEKVQLPVRYGKGVRTTFIARRTLVLTVQGSSRFNCFAVWFWPNGSASAWTAGFSLTLRARRDDTSLV